MFELFTPLKSPVFTAGPPPPKPVPLTLEEEVLALGLQVIPLDRVRAYQQRVVKEWEADGAFYTGLWEQVTESRIHLLNPPVSVTDDIKQAKTIPGTKVYAERFLADPFVFVTRRAPKSFAKHAKFQIRKIEVVCFRCWNAPGFKG